MLDDIAQREQYGLVVAFIAAVAVAFGAGTLVSSGSPTGAITADGDGLSETEIEQQVQSILDQQMQAQQQQFELMAQQDESISADDFSMDASIADVSRADFGSLYRVTVSITGQAPSQTGEGVDQIDQEQELYISADGRYLFQPPTDLEQPQQQAPQTPQQPPTGGQ